MFHVRRRPADCQPRRRKKKSGSLRAGGPGPGGAGAGLLLETQPDGAPADNGRSVRLGAEVVEVGSANGVALQLYGPSIQPRHCVVAAIEGVVTLTPLHTDAHTYVNGQRIYHTTILQHGCLIKFGSMSTFRFVDPAQENKISRNLSQSQHFDSGSVYDRSPTSPVPDNISGMISPVSQFLSDVMQTSNDPSGISTSGMSDFQRAMSPILNSDKMGSQDNFVMSYNSGKNQSDATDNMSGYNNNNNNNVKMDGESLILSQHLANSKADLLQENHFASPYNGIGSPQNLGSKDQLNSGTKSSGSQYKDNYETTFDLDGNVETKSICSAKSGGSGHDSRMPRGQEAILPAVLEFPEQCQPLFLQSVISALDVNAPAFKLAPVYTLYLCARYRASTHYRPELSPTERANKLTALLHHIATLIQNTVQEKYSDAAVQAFWMANSSELLHFLKCDRHIAAFSLQAQDILAHTVQTAFSNLVGCFHVELSQVLGEFLEEKRGVEVSGALVLGALGAAMALLRRCRVNAALTIQLFSQLFHYINVWCFNKVVTSPHMWCSRWGALLGARLAPVGAWAERQGLELAADCHLMLIHQCVNLLQAPKNTPEDMANLTSTCYKLNSVQLRCLLGGFCDGPQGAAGPGQRLSPDLVEAAVRHAQGVTDELHRADGREITLEESSTLPLSLLIPEDGFSADVVRGLPSGLAEFLQPLQRASLCRLAPQPHSQGHWTVYMTGFQGSGMTVRPPQQPVVQVIKLQKNANGIGLSIVAAKGAGQPRLGIYIKSVVAGGAAAADKRLQAGDQLLSVDGYSLMGISQERAAETMMHTGPCVTLEVAKQGAVLHGLATLLRQHSPQTGRGSQMSNSGIFTNKNPTYTKKTRPESEIITANIHPAENSYAIRSVLVEEDGYPTRPLRPNEGCFTERSRTSNGRDLMFMREESKSSSEESLVNSRRIIPRVVIDYDQDQEERPPAFGNNLNSKTPVKTIPPTFSFTDFDKACSSEIRTACESFIMFEESSRHPTCHREQSVDSSNQSCDSDCTYSGCAEQNSRAFETTSHYSYGEEPKMERQLKLNFDTSKEQSLCRSFQTMDDIVGNSADGLNSIEICRSGNDSDEIPYIDDIDSEPLIFEHKSCSREDIFHDNNPQPCIRTLFSDVTNSPVPLKKIPRDVGINERLIKLELEDTSACDEVPNQARCTQSRDIDSESKSSQNDFLGQSQKDHNFFSKKYSNSKKDSNKNVYRINGAGDVRFPCDHYNNNVSKCIANCKPVKSNRDNEYNILESNFPEKRMEKNKRFHSTKDISNLHGELLLDLSISDSSRPSNMGTKNNKTNRISKSNDFLDKKSEIKSWKSPENIRLGCGKVKALADHFNNINLVYQSKSYLRSCQSSPNLFHRNEKIPTLQNSTVLSASLVNMSMKSKSDSSFKSTSSNKYSDEEQKKIMEQLEDWSKFGTKGSPHKFVNIETNNNKSKLTIQDSKKIIPSYIKYNEIIRNEPRPTNSNLHVNASVTTRDEISPLNKKFGSLEKLTGSLVPRVIEMIPRKTVSSPNVARGTNYKPAIEKKKLILPRKKFPHSYIVRKKSTTGDNLGGTKYDNIIQSCPNLSGYNFKNKCNFGLAGDLYHSCPNLIKNNSINLYNGMGPSYMRICRIKNPLNELKNRPISSRYAWIRYGPTRIMATKSKSYEDISPRRMSERDLPGKLELEQSGGGGAGGGHLPATVKSSKSVPALHEHTKHHEVFNPGYSRTSSNNSIPAMAGLKAKSPHMTQQSLHNNPADQNSFYQNLSVYRNTGLGDRSSTLRNSQNGLQPQSQSQHNKPNMTPEGQGLGQSASERLSQSSAGNQRPQSAYYPTQPPHSPAQSTNGMRTAQSTKDLVYSPDGQGNQQVRGNYPSMPNVNQGYNTNLNNNASQSYGQMPGGYNTNSYGRAPMSPNQYGAQGNGNAQYGNQPLPNNPNQFSKQGGNQYNSQATLGQYGAGSNPNLRGQAKMAEMSEEVTRRQQRGPLGPHGDQNPISPMQQNRFQYGPDSHGANNGPMSPTKPQPPVAPKPQGMKRGVSGDLTSQDVVEGPPLPPSATHPLYHQPNDEDGSYLASASDPPALSFYPTQRPGQVAQGGQHIPPNPWEREEREKELEARRLAARVWRDKQISGLQALGEDRRTPQQEQQLRALTLERDFQRRAQEAQTEEDDKDGDGRGQAVPPHAGLLRVTSSNNNLSPVSNTPQDLNLVPVTSNIVSSIQPVSVATSNTNGGDQQQDNHPNQQEMKSTNQLPPPPPVQPKSILKSNLRLDNLNSNTPQSPSKAQKNASFSANLTPQTLKFDNAPKYETGGQKYDNSKYDHNVNNKYDTNVLSKYDGNQPKYQEQTTATSGKYEQNYPYNMNNSPNVQTLPKYDSNVTSNSAMPPTQLMQNMSNLNMNSNANYNQMEIVETNIRYDNQQYGQQNLAYTSAPPPPERGSSFAVMSQQQALRSNVSTSSQMSVVNQNANMAMNQALAMKDKRVSFHDNDQSNMTMTMTSSVDGQECDMEPIREDPDRFLLEAESMLQSPTSPNAPNITHTPGVIGSQEVYRDPRQRRLAEQQKAQQAGSLPIPEKLSFKEKMKMFALESGESNTPKDKVKISRAQRDIDAVH